MRETLVVTETKIQCKLNDDYFGPWTELTEEQQRKFIDSPTHCGSGGSMGSWCEDCPFCQEFDETSYEEEVEEIRCVGTVG